MASQFLLIFIGAAGLSVLDGKSLPRDPQIVPGSRPLDTSGNEVHAHGGGMLEVSGTYFWYGLSQKQGPDWIAASVNLYTSSDLLTWVNMGPIFSTAQLGAPYTQMERPKMIYSRDEGTWVLILEVDTVPSSRPAIGFAESTTLEGPFTWVHAFQPPGVSNFSVAAFQDDDSWQSYLLHRMPAGAGALGITRLQGNGVEPDKETCGNGPSVFSPAVFSAGGVGKRHSAHYYYMLASRGAGPRPAPPVLLWSTSMCGPWQEALAPAIGAGADTLYDSQPAFVMPLRLEDGSSLLLYMGDRWNMDGLGSVGNATYVWLPLLPRRDGSGYEVRHLAAWSPHQVVGWQSQSLADLLLLGRGVAGLRAVAHYLGPSALLSIVACFGMAVLLVSLTMWRSLRKRGDRFEEEVHVWEPLLTPAPALRAVPAPV